MTITSLRSTSRLTIRVPPLQDGVLYVVQGEPLEITALRAIPDEGTKAATISSATYYWDGIPAERIFASPFPVTVNTTDMEVGRHTRSLCQCASGRQIDRLRSGRLPYRDCGKQ